MIETGLCVQNVQKVQYQVCSASSTREFEIAGNGSASDNRRSQDTISAYIMKTEL